MFFRCSLLAFLLGGGRAVACLTQNEARLSQPCQAALAEHQ